MMCGFKNKSKLDEANAGKLIPHEEVKSQFEEKRARLLAKLAAQ